VTCFNSYHKVYLAGFSATILSFKVHNLVSGQSENIKPSQMTHFNVIFYVKGSVYQLVHKTGNSAQEQRSQAIFGTNSSKGPDIIVTSRDNHTLRF